MLIAKENILSGVIALAMLFACADLFTIAAQSSVNLAFGKTATQSADMGSPFRSTDGLASKAVDGATDGNWNSGSVTHTACGGLDAANDCRGSADPWWRVDLGADFQINRIQIWNRTDCCQERLNSWRLWVKSSTGNWEAFTGNMGLRSFDPSEKNPVTFQGSKQARFVMVQIVNPSAVLSLAEVMVFGTALSPAMTPVSPGSTADIQFWDAVKNSQRAQDYQSYLAAFPNGQFVAVARFKMNSLMTPAANPVAGTGTGTVGNSNVDEQFWNLVKDSTKTGDFQSYLNAFPNGQFIALAKFKMGQLAPTPSLPTTTPTTGGGGVTVDEQFWNNVKNSSNARDFQSYLDNFPNGQFASLARFNRDRLGGVAGGGGTPVTSPPVGATVSIDEQFWNTVKSSSNPRDFQSYLDNFPNGQFVSLARFNRDRLGGVGAGPVNPSTSSTSKNATFLNQLAADNRAKLPITVGDVQLFDAVSLCQSGCQQTDNNESVVVRARTPKLAKQNISIGAIEQFLKPALLKGYCGSPDQLNNVTMGVDVDDMFNQKIGNFFINARDCPGTTGIIVNPPATVTQPSATAFQQVIAAAQPGSISEISRARRFFVVSNDFNIKSKISAAILKELPQMQAASTEQGADFLIGFELTDRTTGLVTPNNSSNPNLRGELIVFTRIPAANNSPESIRILFRVTKERGFGVFSATPDENAAKEFAKQLAKVII